MSTRYLANFDLAKLPQVSCDILVVGTGIAGLYTALKVRDVGRVIVLTKRKLEESNTEYAQGGIAAAIGTEDSPRLHFVDTLEAGAGLCDEGAVNVLVEEGPDCVRELIGIGTQFDKTDEGEYALTREGAHSKRRILHARGDATGDEIRRALQQKVYADGIIVYENHWGELFFRHFTTLKAFKAFIDDRRQKFTGAQMHYYVRRSSLYYEKIIERTKMLVTHIFDVAL